MSTDLYVYAVTTPAAGDADLGKGIDDHPLKVITSPGGVCAVVHDHSGGPYEGADDDVRRWVLQHSDVVERVQVAAEAVLPVSFNVIVADEDDDPALARLERWLTENADGLAGRLTQLHGRVELRVEIALEVEAVAHGHPQIQEMRAEAESRPAGVRRLLGKRLEQRGRELADALADELYPDYRARLAGVAEDLVENRGSRAEDGQVPVASFAVLLPSEQTEALGLALAEIRDTQPAARIRFLGPWPPYSFADVTQLTS